MATYKATTNTVPVYGEKSSAVLELQKKLNALGAGLTTDGMYGPLTQAAATKYATQLAGPVTPPAPVVPPPVVKEKLTYALSPEEKALKDALADSTSYFKKQGAAKIDEKQIMADTLAMFQGEINATNSIYADKLKRAQVEGTGRLGTSAAVNARRGLAGSDFGNASTDTVVGANEEIYSSIENEKRLATTGLMTAAKAAGIKSIQDKRAAKEAGLTEYMTHLTTAGEAAKNRAKELAKVILAGKFKYDEYDPTALEEAAKSAGVTLSALKSAYEEQRLAKEKEQAEIQNKEASITDLYGAGAIGEYNFAKANGYTGTFTEYQNEDANRKAKATGTGLTPYQQFQATQSVAKDNQMRTENAREMARQAALIEQSYQNIAKGGDRSLNTQAIITSFNKILDPTSVVRESEYDRTAQGQSLLAQLQGKYDNIVAGGAGVTEATLKEASDIAKRYLEGAKTSIAAQNKRAEDMARAFGLNPDFVTNTYQDESLGGGETKEINGVQYEKVDGGWRKVSFNSVGGDTKIATVDEAMRRLARNESQGSGGYSARGPVVVKGQYKGERALGKYQVMPGNLPEWSREALGRVVSPEEFMANPQLQELIVKKQLEKKYKQYGNWNDVASVWFTGQPLALGANKRDVLGTTGLSYVRKFNG